MNTNKLEEVDLKKISEQLHNIDYIKIRNEIINGTNINLVINAIKYCEILNIDLKTNNNQLFRLACFYGRYEVVDLLLNSGKINPNDFFSGIGIDTGLFFGLFAAVLKNRINVVELLLNHPVVDPFIMNNAAFKLALTKNQTEIIKLFIKNEKFVKFLLQ